jgi:CheY-like chemotaxis protein
LVAIDSACAKDSPFDLILLDAQMPDMDGFMLAEQIRKRPGAVGITILMLTSGGQPGDAARCKELGFAAYLTKPVKQADLWRALVRGLDAGPVQPPLRVTRPAPSRPLRILLAEDNVLNQKLAVRLLERQGHSVTVASNGRQAIDTLFSSSSPKFDVVLMDVQMPELDGLDATKAIREREQHTGEHIPIVAMTAHAMKGDQERCLAAGMDGYVSKPIKLDGLFAILAELTSSTAVEAGRDLPSIVNWNATLGHVRGDVALLRELAVIFLDEWPGWDIALRQGLTENDFESVRRSAHTIKGSLGTFAATVAHAAAERIEQAARDGDRDAVIGAFNQLEHGMAVLLPAMNAFAHGGEA